MGLSRGCQGLCQGLVKGLSRACQGVVKGYVKGLSRVCHGLVKGLSRACQGLVKVRSHTLVVPVQAAAWLCRFKSIVHGAIDKPNELGEVPLVRAAADGASDSDLRLLVLAGADVHATNREGATALCEAARYGHLQTVRTLQDLGGDVNTMRRGGGAGTWCPYKWFTALMMAAKNGHTETVQEMVRLRADVHARAEVSACGAVWRALACACGWARWAVHRALCTERVRPVFMGAVPHREPWRLSHCAKVSHVSSLGCFLPKDAQQVPRKWQQPPGSHQEATIQVPVGTIHKPLGTPATVVLRGLFK